MSTKLYILSKKADRGFIKIIGTASMPNEASYKAELRKAAVLRFGGVVGDYVVLTTDNQTDMERHGEGPDVSWETESAQPVFSYARIEGKARLSASAPPGVKADGVASVTVTITAKRRSDDATASGFNGEEFIRVRSPDERDIPVQVSFVDGVGVIAFKTTLAGDWEFPSPSFSDPRLLNSERPDRAIVSAYLTEF